MNHPSIGNGTLNGSGASTPPRDALRQWRVAGRYILARSREHALECYRDGEGRETPYPHEDRTPPARVVRAVFD